MYCDYNNVSNISKYIYIYIILSLFMANFAPFQRLLYFSQLRPALFNRTFCTVYLFSFFFNMKKKERCKFSKKEPLISQ